LIRLLENAKACDLAVNTLGSIGPDAASAVPNLLRLGPRKWVIIALGRIGPAAKDAVPMLKDLRTLDAARALWRIDPRYTQLALEVVQRGNQG